ncbi:uncharacterized protein LOC127860679 [Dreissena polymorpha]|uniref:uncharacterized protein LOC127860679 n=1 Tax=Dreissena polymorpha TaxID=45954 RepID=UPI002263C299|nr:uncharacterized protein LOC127860679 [Dreissena polymorpha]
MTATKTGFVLGKSRLAPSNTTSPRLELCAAVLATEVAEIISENLDYPMERFIFHSDSIVVLGYLNNQSRRFYTNVANRVQIILKRTNVHQWNYVHASNNPASLATRCATPAKKWDAIHHQGRHYTEGAIRNHGYWIVGVKRLVSSIIYQCVTCRRLRGNFVNQQMANLPEDRLTPGPPFTYVGVDTFGPWPVVTRRTRGGIAESKRWAIIFVCLVTRASHIEVIEDMSSSDFINALRRFISVRGPVKEFRSDRGTNFVGALKDI